MPFAFECRYPITPYGQFRVRVEMESIEGGVEVNTDDIEMTKQLFMPQEVFAKFNDALGAAPDADPIETARAAVVARKNLLVGDLVETLSTYQHGTFKSDSTS